MQHVFVLGLLDSLQDDFQGSFGQNYVSEFGAISCDVGQTPHSLFRNMCFFETDNMHKHLNPIFINNRLTLISPPARQVRQNPSSLKLKLTRPVPHKLQQPRYAPLVDDLLHDLKALVIGNDDSDANYSFELLFYLIVG